MIRILIYIIFGLPVVVIMLYTVVRIVRLFCKFPMPQFFANVIDSPLRRKIQPPDEIPIRHGIEPGMTVLEVGPGNGTYTIATARRIGDKGKLVTIDIEPEMIERVKRRVEEEGIKNIEAQVADVYNLPFEDGFFDAIYMIAVIGEIPNPDRAIKEFYRVLSSSGILVFSELLFDPDYPRAKTLVRKATSRGFRLKRRVGTSFYYTLIFERLAEESKLP